MLQSNLEELERLRSIVNDMLFLARADQGEAATGLVEAAVAHEVEKTIEFFEPCSTRPAGQRRHRGRLRREATIERPLFRRALSNLLQNAIEHSQPGARLAVRIPSAPALGLGERRRTPARRSPALHLPRLFDRFYRVDAARHDKGEHHGHGLGLAIVKAVATMHGGGVGGASDGGVTTIGFSVRSRSPAPR